MAATHEHWARVKGREWVTSQNESWRHESCWGHRLLLLLVYLKNGHATSRSERQWSDPFDTCMHNTWFKSIFLALVWYGANRHPHVCSSKHSGLWRHHICLHSHTRHYDDGTRRKQTALIRVFLCCRALCASRSWLFRIFPTFLVLAKRCDVTVTLSGNSSSYVTGKHSWQKFLWKLRNFFSPPKTVMPVLLVSSFPPACHSLNLHQNLVSCYDF